MKIIDGEWIIALYNDSNETRTINPQDRIAQLIIQPYIVMPFKEVEELSSSERNNGGFGSTGIK